MIKNVKIEGMDLLPLGAMGLFLSGAGKVSLDYLIFPRRRLKSAVTPG